MTNTLTKRAFNLLSAMTLVTVLSVGLIQANLHTATLGTMTAQVVTSSTAATLVGGSIGACGILVGIGIGLIAAAASGATVGIGGALVISAGIHVAGALCVS